jgi:hypothetical protein
MLKATQKKSGGNNTENHQGLFFFGHKQPTNQNRVEPPTKNETKGIDVLALHPAMVKVRPYMIETKVAPTRARFRFDINLVLSLLSIFCCVLPINFVV